MDSERKRELKKLGKTEDAAARPASQTAAFYREVARSRGKGSFSRSEARG